MLEARATYQLTSWLGASLGTSLVTEPWRLVDPSRDHERRSRLQLVVEPALSAACGRHFDLGLDGSIPVGGNLGGNAFAVGLRARVSY